jgi:hypothetical protein
MSIEWDELDSDTKVSLFALALCTSPLWFITTLFFGLFAIIPFCMHVCFTMWLDSKLFPKA